MAWIFNGYYKCLRNLSKFIVKVKFVDKQIRNIFEHSRRHILNIFERYLTFMNDTDVMNVRKNQKIYNID